MIDKLQNKANRDYFYLIIIFLLIIIFSTRHFILPYLYEEKIDISHNLFYEILDKLFSSVLVTIGLATFIFWLTPKNKLNAQMKIIQPIEIKDIFKKSMLETDFWIFNGGSGRYTRNQTIPNLALLSQEKNKSIDISIVIINPKNEDVISQYADYKNSLRTSKKREKKTIKSVQLDLITTILSCHIWKTEQPLLNINLYLKNHFSIFRIDISTKKVIITKEDPNEPAILFEKETFFYTSQIEEQKQVLKQFSKVNLLKFVGLKNINASEIKNLSTQLNLDILLKEEDYKEILKKIKSNENPYE
jgi:hypothetical protein